MICLRCVGVLTVAALVSGCVTERRLSHGFMQSGKLATDVEVRPVGNEHLLPTLETRDPVLVAALLKLTAFPGALQHRRVAERYRELGILDTAFDYFARARHLDPTDATAHEALARIWRDWGFPHLGLEDARRAVHHAPSWPLARNTLGTLLAATGRNAEAREAYVSALAIDATSAYVWNNLCYLSFLEGVPARAVAECAAALEIDSGLTAARNNLALAYAASGRGGLALQELQRSGDAAAGLYNLGILHLARMDYSAAVEAFTAAHKERPTWAAARERLRQAIRAASAEERAAR
jgi:Flp pilus assembly protein TadD